MNYSLNPLESISFVNSNVFEVYENVSCEKKIFFDGDEKCKYASLINGGDYNLSFFTKKENISANIVILCPITGLIPLNLHINFNIVHSNCDINLHLVSLLYTEGKTFFDASIMVGNDVSQSSASLLEESIILSDNVDVKNIPILDINSCDVQVSHGAKICGLNDYYLFYLQSKGLAINDARSLLIGSYFEDLFKDTNISDEEKKHLLLSCGCDI